MDSFDVTVAKEQAWNVRKPDSIPSGCESGNWTVLAKHLIVCFFPLLYFCHTFHFEHFKNKKIMWLFSSAEVDTKGSSTSDTSGSQEEEQKSSSSPSQNKQEATSSSTAEPESAVTEAVEIASTNEGRPKKTSAEGKKVENKKEGSNRQVVSLHNLAAAAVDPPARQFEGGEVFKAVKKALTVDVETGKNLESLSGILKDADFLRKKVPDVADMSDEEFGRTRDLVCVVLSHLQNRIVTANGFCKTGRTNFVTSWRGKCQASGAAVHNPTPVKRRKTVKCHCKFSFHLNRQGQIFFKGEHSCPETDRNTLCSSNKLLSYTLSDAAKADLLHSSTCLLCGNPNLKRRDIERHVDGELRRLGVLPKNVSSGSFARVLYTQARTTVDPSFAAQGDDKSQKPKEPKKRNVRKTLKKTDESSTGSDQKKDGETSTETSKPKRAPRATSKKSQGSVTGKKRGADETGDAKNESVQENGAVVSENVGTNENGSNTAGASAAFAEVDSPPKVQTKSKSTSTKDKKQKTQTRGQGSKSKTAAPPKNAGNVSSKSLPFKKRKVQ